jgi:hypothetical protein
MKVLYTHFNVDLDAAASVWAAREFISGARDCELVFVSANWDGAGIDEDAIALDIVAGGHGFKGEQYPDGTIGSCFALIVKRYASAEDQEALASLVNFVDAQDAHASAVNWLAPEASREARTVLGDTGLNGVLRALQAVHPRNDALVVERMSEIFSGMLRAGRARRRASVEADRAELIGDGRVAIVRDAQEYATNAILYDRGVKVIVYVDGHNLGVIREGSVTLRTDDPALRAVVEAAGEEVGDGDGKWFAHPAGFIFAWGTRKGPATYPSRVRPEDLAASAYRLLG